MNDTFKNLISLLESIELNKDQLDESDNNDQLIDVLQQLEEQREQMENLLREIHETLYDLKKPPETSMIAERALAYWYPSIESMVVYDGRGSMVNMPDTIEELREIVNNGENDDEE